MSNGMNWSKEVTKNENYHTPKETFTKKASEIVLILMQSAQGHPELALRRLIFYMNRAGSKPSNIDQLEKAKAILEEKIESNADGC